MSLDQLVMHDLEGLAVHRQTTVHARVGGGDDGHLLAVSEGVRPNLKVVVIGTLNLGVERLGEEDGIRPSPLGVNGEELPQKVTWARVRV